jgi:hypothetical protein
MNVNVESVRVDGQVLEEGAAQEIGSGAPAGWSRGEDGTVRVMMRR